MRRYFGALLVLHGLAHAGAGTWTAPLAPVWPVSGLWWIAMVGFIAAGAGLMGVPRLRASWRKTAAAAAVASLGLLALERSAVSIAGVVVDLAVLAMAIPFLRRRIALVVGMPLHPASRRLSRLATVLLATLITYVAAVVALRPWFSRWGTTAEERASALPGDSLVPVARYRIDHGVTIHAPADSVWPWIAQIGQNRAGFYSYDWLERAIGDPVHNADAVVPQWQRIAPGDFVRAAPRRYAFGILGDSLGWPVADVVPGRALVLRNWGAFVLRPIDDSTTRFLVRSRRAGAPTFAGLPIAPLELLVLEPAHFIMERRMMLGVKARAERGRAAATLARGGP